LTTRRRRTRTRGSRGSSRQAVRNSLQPPLEGPQWSEVVVVQPRSLEEHHFGNSLSLSSDQNVVCHSQHVRHCAQLKELVTATSAVFIVKKYFSQQLIWTEQYDHCQQSIDFYIGQQIIIIIIRQSLQSGIVELDYRLHTVEIVHQFGFCVAWYRDSS